MLRGKHLFRLDLQVHKLLHKNPKAKLHNVIYQIVKVNFSASNVRSDAAFKNAIGWPQIDENDGRLKEFVAAAVENKIEALGILGKATFGAHEKYDKHSNRKCFAKRLIEWDVEFDESTANDRHFENPFIMGYAHESCNSTIRPNDWQKDGIIWMRNTLILHNHEIANHRSKALDARPSPEVYLEMAALHPDVFDGDTKVPNIHMFQYVKINEASLSDWLIGTRKLGNIIANKRSVGRPKSYQWKYVDEFALEFIDTGIPYASHGEFYRALAAQLRVNQVRDKLFVEPILSKSAVRGGLPDRPYWARLEPLYHNSKKAGLVSP